jgi:hypothetical protein
MLINFGTKALVSKPTTLESCEKHIYGLEIQQFSTIGEENLEVELLGYQISMSIMM